MRKSFSVYAIGVILAASVWVALTTHANDDPMARFAPLLNDSPFLTIAFKERLAQTETAPTRNLRFTGYAKIDGNWLLCIHNTQSGESNWVRIDDTLGDFLIKSFDLRSETITLVANNREIPLALDKP